MEVRQIQVKALAGADLAKAAAIEPALVLVFGAVAALDAPDAFETLKRAFPGAALAGCSTAGEITAKGVADNSVVITAVSFGPGVRLQVAEAAVPAMAASNQAGAQLGRALAAPDLAAVLLFGKGVDVNGSALIEGVTGEIGSSTAVSGGLAGDGGAFARTLTLTPSGIHTDRVVAVGLYGKAVKVGHGSFGGWSAFGPPRKITRCEGNVLFELDGQPALDLYREYLGEYAKDLPASGLLFPFEMLDESHGSVGLIRTILGIDEASGSLVLAGDIDPSGYLRLMHASSDALVDGAEAAAWRIRDRLGCQPEGGFAILVSCVGRKLVMGDAVDDEVEAVSEVLGRATTLTGFYSYGEIAPFFSTTDCKLHNQTMTVTFVGED